jgi:hypothetical protein
MVDFLLEFAGPLEWAYRRRISMMTAVFDCLWNHYCDHTLIEWLVVRVDELDENFVRPGRKTVE